MNVIGFRQLMAKYTDSFPNTQCMCLIFHIMMEHCIVTCTANVNLINTAMYCFVWCKECNLASIKVHIGTKI